MPSPTKLLPRWVDKLRAEVGPFFEDKISRYLAEANTRGRGPNLLEAESQTPKELIHFSVNEKFAQNPKFDPDRFSSNRQLQRDIMLNEDAIEGVGAGLGSTQPGGLYWAKPGSEMAGHAEQFVSEAMGPDIQDLQVIDGVLPKGTPMGSIDLRDLGMMRGRALGEAGPSEGVRYLNESGKPHKFPYKPDDLPQLNSSLDFMEELKRKYGPLASEMSLERSPLGGPTAVSFALDRMYTEALTNHLRNRGLKGLNIRSAETWNNASSPLKEIVQLQPNTVWLPEYNKMLGAAGTAGAAALASPGDAEAAPFGPAVKQTLQSAAKLGMSAKSHDDAYKLAGRSFNFPAIGGPGEVVDVLKGKQGIYTAIVQGEDGARHEIPMTKDYFKLLMQSSGAEEYIGKFNTSSKPMQDIQASTGLTIRETKRANTDDVTHGQLVGIEHDAVQKIKEMSPDLAQHYVYFKSAQDLKPLYIPKVYADRLTKMGVGRIIKEGSK